MTLAELKTQIENKKVTDDTIIFKYTDNKFLCYQYIDAIAEIKDLPKKFIESLSEMNPINNFFDNDVACLYVYDVEKLTEQIPVDTKNLIVVSKTLPKNLEIDFTEVPALVAWQVEDFIKYRATGLTDKQIKWLCEIANYDVYRLNNECKKLEIFSPAVQKAFFETLSHENSFCDLNKLTILSLINAVMKKDVNTLYAILKEIKYIDIEGPGLISIFNKQFKQLIDVQLNPNATAESLGISPKQLNAIRYNCGKYTPKQVVAIYKFISDLDFQLKNGDLQFATGTTENNIKMVEYIILQLIILGNS